MFTLSCSPLLYLVYFYSLLFTFPQERKVKGLRAVYFYFLLFTFIRFIPSQLLILTFVENWICNHANWCLYVNCQLAFMYNDHIDPEVLCQSPKSLGQEGFLKSMEPPGSNLAEIHQGWPIKLSWLKEEQSWKVELTCAPKFGIGTSGPGTTWPRKASNLPSWGRFPTL